MHTEFTQVDDPDPTSQKVAYSFVTVRDSATVYLVPSSDNTNRIEAKMTSVPQYFFQLGSLLSDEEIKMIKKAGGGSIKK